jgi:beta-lactamase regulating signal transducer with metallopeptidase domain/Flp pilus assembly secretin CpaC
MNSFIETLNHLGYQFLNFAWPMLWQSSLLIAIVFVLEFALRRKIRAAIRYALWLVVLVKLLLPPALALPTSPTWWIHPSVPPPAKALPVSFTVSYGEQTAPTFPLPPSPVIPPPIVPAISFAAWTLAASCVVSAVLLAWLLFRWRQINQKVRRATVSEELIPILREARRLTHLRPGIRLKLTDDSMSPAVCGLFRPVILLPQSLVEKLTTGQLRAVLLHEAIHLRRGDVWMNCAQALLQIVYWWHPLFWLANARIRRAREEAVDDAVMLALRDDAEIYAPTLLEVAKLAFNRPLASLGLVGILESRSALRQRIERLINFNAPKKAGLTVVSILGILAFSAVALPMGEAPEQTNKPTVSLRDDLPISTNAPENVFQTNSSINTVIGIVSDPKFRVVLHALEQRTGVETLAEPEAVTTSGREVQRMRTDYVLQQTQYSSLPGGDLSTSTNAFGKNLKARNLVQDGILLYEMDKFDDAEVKLRAAIALNPDDQAAKYGLDQVEKARREKEREKDGSQTNYLHWDNSSANLTFMSPPSQIYIINGRQGISYELNHVRLDNVFYKRIPLAHVVTGLVNQLATRDPEGRSIEFAIDQTQLPVETIGLGNVVITIEPPLVNVRLADLLDAIVKGADKPIHYSIEDEGVVFSWKEQKSPPLFVRAFKVDPHTFAAGLQKILGIQTNNVPEMVKSLFSTLGVDLTAPGRNIAFNDRLGLLFATATPLELDTIERALQVLNQVPPEIQIKARFMEVPESDVESVLKAGVAVDTKETNKVEIITATNETIQLRKLESHSGFENLAEPEAVTTSGRQTQMRATEIVTVLTNINPLALKSPGVSSNELFLTEHVECGPVFDVVPYVLSDGYTLNLTTIASMIEFLGYAKPTNSVTVYIDGHKQTVPVPIPKFRTQKISTVVNLWDGQTLVLGGPITSAVQITKNKVPLLGNLPLVGGMFRSQTENSVKKQLMVFVTASIVDPTGNRVHSDDELPFNPSTIPPQPKISTPSP